MTLKSKRLSGLRVYLCGAVERDPEQEWRTRVTKVCENRFKMKVYNPLIKPSWMPAIDGKQQRNMYEELIKQIDTCQQTDRGIQIENNNHATRMYCLALSKNADIIILNYDHKMHTVGTFEEITSNLHKPIFVLAKRKKVSMWLIDQLNLYGPRQMITYLHFTIDSLCSVLGGINNGGIDVKFDPFKWIPITHGE